VTDAKEVGVGNPAEEKTFCHRTAIVLGKIRYRHKCILIRQPFFSLPQLRKALPRFEA
jgi:hypothetical protein